MDKRYSLLKFLAFSCCLLGFNMQVKAQYCTTGLYSYGCNYNDYVHSVSTTGGTTNISNLLSGCNGGSSGYSYFTNKGTLTAMAGSTFNLTVVNNPSYSEQ